VENIIEIMSIMNVASGLNIRAKTYPSNISTAKTENMRRYDLLLFFFYLVEEGYFFHLGSGVRALAGVFLFWRFSRRGVTGIGFFYVFIRRILPLPVLFFLLVLRGMVLSCGSSSLQPTSRGWLSPCCCRTALSRCRIVLCMLFCFLCL